MANRSVRVVGRALTLYLMTVASLFPSQHVRDIGVDPANGDEEVERIVIAAYHSRYSDMSDEHILKVWHGQTARILFSEALASKDISGFEGLAFSAVDNLLRVLVTEGAAKEAITRLAESYEVPIILEDVLYTRVDLESLAQSLIAQNDVYGTNPLGIVGIAASASLNRVRVGVPSEDVLQGLPEEMTGDPRVEAFVTDRKRASSTVCTSRTSCGTPARSGVVIGIDADGAAPGVALQQQSLGYTAYISDGSHWVVTSAHDSSGTGTLPIASFCPNPGACWGHGQQYFGPMRQVRNSYEDHIDVGRIRIDNSYWHTGGYLYGGSNQDRLVPVDYAIQSRTTITEDDAVCFSAWSSNTAPNCGVVTDPSSIFHLAGAVESTPQACRGDSGGGWYMLMSAPVERWAVGIQSAVSGSPANPPPNCTRNADEFSYWSALPDINTWWDAHSSLPVRVEYFG